MSYDFTITEDGPAVSEFKGEKGRLVPRRVRMGKRVIVHLERNAARSRIYWLPTQHHRTWRYTSFPMSAGATQQQVASGVIGLLARRIRSSEQATRIRQAKAQRNATLRSPRARDSQRQRLYDAENLMPEYYHKIGRGSLAEAEAFVAMVLGTTWWQSHPHHLPRLRITGGAKHGLANRGKARIALPPFARTKLICLHELAHILTPVTADVAAHGPEFAQAYIDLVGQFMGEDVARRLRAVFQRGNVKVG